VESEHFFGNGIKKLFKASLPPQIGDSSTLTNLKEKISSTFALSEKLSQHQIDSAAMTLSYFDNDLSDFALLDSTSWDEFIQQKKKILRIAALNASTDESKSRSPFDVSGSLESTSPTKPKFEFSNFHVSSHENPYIVTNEKTPSLTAQKEFTSKWKKSSGSESYDVDCIARYLYSQAVSISGENVISTDSKDNANVNGESVNGSWNFSKSGEHRVWTLSGNDCLVGSVVSFINGVQLSGLDRNIQLALIKQRTRPLRVQFDRLPVNDFEFLTIKKAENLVPNVISTGAVSSNEPSSEINPFGPTALVSASNDATPEASLSSIKYALYFSKYSHSSASKVRKRTESTIKDYIDCDWATAVKEGTGLPQATVTSVYKFIEFELNKLQLFNNKKPQGVGVPDMTDEKWDEVREHIELMVFKKISVFTRTLWPLFSSQSWNSTDETNLKASDGTTNDVQPAKLAYELATPDNDIDMLSLETSIHSKFAYLRFITMENLGLMHPESGSPLQKSSNILVGKEEWYLAMKGFCQAMQLETPGEILSKLEATCKLISHALNTYMESHTSQGLSIDMKCKCGKLHITDSDHCSIEITSPELDSAPAALKSSMDSLSRHSMLLTAAKINSESNQYQLSADDLMPAMTWVLIQANPPNIEYNLWLCSEFRHPTLLRGEEAYCLAQMTSAVEFVRTATATSFEVGKDKYIYFMRRYSSTLKLLIACKEGDLAQTRDLVENHHADVNGLSPDNRDTALTACVRFNKGSILEYLLECRDMNVDTLVNLYMGANQRSTALTIATQKGNYAMVIALLRAGANRYHQNDDGNTPISIANTKKLARIETVLISDPNIVDLVTAIRNCNARLLH